MIDLNEKDILSSYDRSFGIKDKIKKSGEFRVEFGIDFLDDALSGILKNDLIVLGAKTGAGKSQMAVMISEACAKKGKRVGFFALEAEEYEIEMRSHYRKISDIFYGEKLYQQEKFKHIDLNYQDWYINKYGDIFDDVLSRSILDSKDYQQNIFTKYTSNGYTAEDFKKDLFELKHKVDVIVIDHLHYFDFEDGKNENSEITNLTKLIRSQVLELNIPIFLVVHLRKRDKRAKALLPDEDDFHGSSNIIKISTRAVIIARDRNTETHDHSMIPTLFRICKNRFDGSRTMYVGRLMFNYKTMTYEPGYNLCQLSPNEEELIEVEQHRLPKWAKRAVVKSVPGHFATHYTKKKEKKDE